VKVPFESIGLHFFWPLPSMQASVSSPGLPILPKAAKPAPMKERSRICTAPNSHGQWVKANMVCAGYEDERTDARDAGWGGPATIHKYGKDYLIGVMSWGGCAGAKKYGVFTRIAPYVGWIRATLASMRRGPRYYFP